MRVYLEDLTKSEMLTGGYTAQEIADILKEVLVVAHTPSGPIDKSAFSLYAFASSEDKVINHHNAFDKYVRKNSMDLSPSFFPAPLGNLFLVRKSKALDSEDAEHHTSGIPNSEDHMLTDDGKIVFAAERNIIINSTHSSIANAPLPEIRELASRNGRYTEFDRLVRNGENFYTQMLTDLRIKKRIPKPVHQK